MIPDANLMDSLIQRLEGQVPKDNPKITSTISALKEAANEQAEQSRKASEQLKEFEEAYEKLTSPANRLAVFIAWQDKEKGVAQIALGDTEYISAVDPNLDTEGLQRGVRVRLNEGYAVVGIGPDSLNGTFFKVIEVKESGKLRIGREGPEAESRVVYLAEKLINEPVKAGDEVRLEPTGRFVIEISQKSEANEYFLEDIKEISWDKIGGQDDAIKLIRDTIEKPLLHPEIFAAYEKQPVKGVLLYGPPGCGKTLLGKATAYNLTQEYSKRLGKPVKEYFMSISGPKILNMWLGETERMVREIFATARERAKEGRLVFIFMDEAESLLRTRSNGRLLNISNTVVPQFCAELDGLVQLENVILMLTSNRPDFIDPAVLRAGRIDRKVKINRPNREAAEQILGIYLHSSIPIDTAVIAENSGEIDCARKFLIEKLVEELWTTKKSNEFVKVYLRSGEDITLYRKDMLSGALLKSIVDRAKDMAIERALAAPKGAHGITLQDLLSSAESEFKENEIFPTGENLDDWLQLVDQPAENVVRVRPMHKSLKKDYRQATIS